MDILGGVYPGGDELVLIPMGGSVEGELEDLGHRRHAAQLYILGNVLGGWGPKRV